jgi:hypothetical protein
MTSRLVACFLVFALPALAGPLDGGAATPTFKERRAQAQALYDAHDFAKCAVEFETLAQNAPAWSRPVENVYNGACCAALASNTDQAFALLDRLLGYGESRQGRDAVNDADLASLKNDARWKRFEAKVLALEAKDRLDPRIKVVVDADQADRQGAMTKQTVERDRLRRVALTKLLDAGIAKSVRDLLSSSLVFQHGATADEIARANALARQALALAPDFCPAQHMVAITEDRHLIRLGKLQKYGTQYSCNEGKPCGRDPVDPTTTDAERVALCVPPLAEQDETMQ